MAIPGHWLGSRLESFQVTNFLIYILILHVSNSIFRLEVLKKSDWIAEKWWMNNVCRSADGQRDFFFRGFYVFHFLDFSTLE